MLSEKQCYRNKKTSCISPLLENGKSEVRKALPRNPNAPLKLGQDQAEGAPKTLPLRGSQYRQEVSKMLPAASRTAMTPLAMVVDQP